MLNRTISDPFTCYLIPDIRVNSQGDFQNNNVFPLSKIKSKEKTPCSLPQVSDTTQYHNRESKQKENNILYNFVQKHSHFILSF